MISSMTAYARCAHHGVWGNAVWEIRSVNQRYLETYFRLPDAFRGLEPLLRERLRTQLQRGKVECTLRFEGTNPQANQLQLNQELAQLLISQAQWVQTAAGEGQLNPLDILRWPGVLSAPEQDMDALHHDLLAGFDSTLTEFITVRHREGAQINDLLSQRLDSIQIQVNQVLAQMPELVAWQRQRLIDRCHDAGVELDPARLEQEVVLLANKMDVAEELDRLTIHVQETQRILRKGGACGRRLDFMMQEFNRESNTLGSKAINTQVTQAAVELKVLIEQMREQIQNLE